MSNEILVKVEISDEEKNNLIVTDYNESVQTKWFSENIGEIQKKLNRKPEILTATVGSLFKRVRKSPETLFDSHRGETSEFMKILNYSDNKRFSDVSIILKHFNIWNDEGFLLEYGKRAVEKFGDFPMNLELNGKLSAGQPNVENFFSYLMYDWFDPKPGQTYAMLTKYDQFLEVHGKNIFKVLFDIVGGKRYKIYRHVVLWLLYQLLYELGKTRCLKCDKCVLRIDQLKTLVFEVEDLELKLRGIKVVAVYWIISCTDEHKLTQFNEFAEQSKVDDELSLEFSEISKETRGFLDLCFLLKNEKHSVPSTDLKLTKFQEKFKRYVDDSSSIFGDYTPVAIGHNLQLLGFLAIKEEEEEEMSYNTDYSPYNYIADNSPFQRDSTILSVFEMNSVMTGFKVYNFKSQQLETLFQKLKKDKKNRNEILRKLLEDPTGHLMTCSEEEFTSFLFKRILSTELEPQEESLFEKILSTPRSGDLIRLIWSKTKASTRSTLSGMNNCNRKYLLEYAIDSGDDENVLAFLSPSIDEKSLTVPEVNLRFLNRQYTNIKKKPLFCRFVEVCNEKSLKNERMIDGIFQDSNRGDNLCLDFYKILLCLLQDGPRIQDIRNAVPIDDLLKVASDPNEKKNIRETIDVLLGSIVAFWSKSDPNYTHYKEMLLVDGQFKSLFAILLSIIDNGEIEDETATKRFRNTFRIHIYGISKVFVDRHGRNLEDSRPRKYFLGLIILTAILNNRKDVIDFILKSESVQDLKLFFPPNMQKTDTTNYFVMKMLENGYDIGRKEFPLLWINSEQLKKFLNQRMKYIRADVIEVDYRFMTHFHIQDKPEREACVQWEETKCLEFILEDHSLKDLITHPTIATYIDLKMHGFRSIYWKNFWFFALLIALPFGVLVTSYFSDSDRQTVVIMSSICAISIIILISREFFQFFVIGDSFRGYIKQSSNILEVCLILVASATLAVILSGDYMNEHLGRFFGSYVIVIKFISVTLMLLFTLDLLATLQNAAMPFYFILLQKVAVTFLRFLGTFMVFLIAFTISFVVFFGDDSEVTNTELANDEPITNGTDLGSNEERDEVFLNFVKFPKAFMKIILMLSGEYSIEPFRLTAPELILFFVFVITTFILFNLILGLTMDDVQTLKKEARAIILQQNAENINKTSSFILKILDKSHGFQQRHEKSSRFLKYIIQFLVARAEAVATKHLLHKGDQFHINVSTRNVTFYKTGSKQGAPRSRIRMIRDFISGIFVNHTFVMDRENLEEIKALLSSVNQNSTF